MRQAFHASFFFSIPFLFSSPRQPMCNIHNRMTLGFLSSLTFIKLFASISVSLSLTFFRLNSYFIDLFRFFRSFVWIYLMCCNFSSHTHSQCRFIRLPRIQFSNANAKRYKTQSCSRSHTHTQYKYFTSFPMWQKRILLLQATILLQCASIVKCVTNRLHLS